MERTREKTILHIPDGQILEDGVLKTIYKDKVVTMSSTKRYHNCLYLLAGLPPKARNLMEFLIEEMNVDNIVYNNIQVREKFINFMNKIDFSREEGAKDTYTDQSVKQAFMEISRTKLMTSLSRGVFKINPEYFFYGSEDSRIGELIKLELEFLPTGTKIKTTKTRR